GLAVSTAVLQDLSDDVLPIIFRFLSSEALTEGWKTISKYHAGSLARTSSSNSQFDDVLKSFFQNFRHVGSPSELREKCPNYVIDLALSLS
ncbi:hypothetical protein QOZ60_30665, partial [Pseudomonas aeruginosa]|uniref:hypothetical protein n=1 Tax=Pseudomonas aeruginosa TaxID=287 RepID=UPI003458C816